MSFSDEAMRGRPFHRNEVQAVREQASKVLPRTVRPGSHRAVTAIPNTDTVSGLVSEMAKHAATHTHETPGRVYKVSGASGLLTFELSVAIVPKAQASPMRGDSTPTDTPDPAAPQAFVFLINARSRDEAIGQVYAQFGDRYYVDIADDGATFGGYYSPKETQQ